MPPGKTGRKGTKGPRASARAEKSAKPARPVLGNDPFARGAAPRPPVAPLLDTGPRAAPQTPAPTPTPTPTPTATPASHPEAAHPERSDAAPAAERSRGTPPVHPRHRPAPSDRVSDAAQRLAALERRVETTLEGLEARLSGVVARTGIATAGGELKDAAARWAPRARELLTAIVDVVRLVEPPERLDAWGLDPRFAERAEPLLDLLYAGWWRVEVLGIAQVPASGPVIVVANRGGFLPWDALMLRHALRRDHPRHRDLRPLLDDRDLAVPIFGGAAIRAGAVRASPDAAEGILRDGGALGVFPEGSAGARKEWRDRYRLQRFGRGGFVKIALRTGAAIVPCAIVGSEEATPPLARTGWLADLLGVPALSASMLRVGVAAALPLPTKWSLRFGAPIALDGLGPSAADDAATVNAVTARVRETLQAMLDESVAARGSVFL
jgi:1-acyl-sn-glycerol-3-phosphate acyltransferase